MNGNGNGHYTNVSCRYHFLAVRTRTLKALTTGNGHHCFNFLTKIRDLSERYTYIQLLGDKQNSMTYIYTRSNQIITILSPGLAALTLLSLSCSIRCFPVYTFFSR